MAWTTPRDWTNGELVTEAIMDTHVRDNLKAITEWTTYTPTWTATGGTPTIGNGTIVGRYVKAGNLCHVWMFLSIGSTTSLGTTTAWRLALPAAAIQPTTLTASILDAGTTYYIGAALIAVGGSTTVQVVTHGSGNDVSYNQPMTWAASDILRISGSYEC